MPTRRTLLAGLAAAALAPSPRAGAEEKRVRTVALRPAPARLRLAGAANPATDVWAYNGAVPGPLIRARIGDRLSVEVENALADETTVHWHGLRVPNSMDGVPHLTQKPIAPGQRFVYEFDLKDSGTYWYHPHANSAEQVERGLAGALIVDEAQPPEVDAEWLWVLKDWRLTPAGAIAGGFGNLHDKAHAGRLGNTVTVNGAVPETVAGRAGNRVRLRLVNAANGRVFALGFGALKPVVVALDGHAVPPHAPPGERVVLGPGMRADLVLDLAGLPGAVLPVIDDFFPRQAYKLLDIVLAEAAPEGRAGAPVSAPAPNALPEPDLAAARRHTIVMAGGARGRLAEAELDGKVQSLRDIAQQGYAWALNGKVTRADRHDHHAPMLVLKRGESCLLSFVNDTAWHHPMHLHGHVFRVVARGAASEGAPKPTPHREWRDTALVAPGERVDIAFVADNPGDWMLHCHILEHQAAGMMTTVRVE
jgi:FtsP/CotA-like multicopper oxidase with cupredoxin domain